MAGQSDSIGHMERIARAVSAVRERCTLSPLIGIILGTGLGHVADLLTASTAIAYSDIPGFPQTTVAGHAGRLVFGDMEGIPVVVMQGRFHLYEGYAPSDIAFPVRLLRMLGVKTLVVTNAAGGLNDSFRAGDLMLIRDHIGFATMAGLNPLLGPNDERVGPRFPSVTDAYSEELRRCAREAAAQLGLDLQEGVYVMVTGPNYETPAELRFLKLIGADAVGMSTVPEVLTAVHAGMKVLAISCITNVAFDPASQQVHNPQHADVVYTAEQSGERLGLLVRRIVTLL